MKYLKKLLTLNYSDTMSRDDVTRRDYTHRAKEYGQHVRTYTDETLLDQMWEGLQPLPELKGAKYRALDLASGTGLAAKRLVAEGFDVSYLDLTETMIEKGKEKAIIPADADTMVGNIRDFLPYERVFDVVLCRYAFHDVPETEQPYLIEMARDVIRPGGKLQIIDMCSPFTNDEAPEVGLVYNFYHAMKSRGNPRICWIPDAPTMYKMFTDAGLVDLHDEWYRSDVVTGHWLREGQITKDRYELLNRFFIDQAGEFPAVTTTFRIARTEFEVDEGMPEESVKVSFPVIILTGTVPEQ